MYLHVLLFHTSQVSDCLRHVTLTVNVTLLSATFPWVLTDVFAVQRERQQCTHHDEATHVVRTALEITRNVLAYPAMSANNETRHHVIVTTTRPEITLLWFLTMV